jgi:Heavy metal binding domain
MSGNKRWPTVALAGVLVALSALAGCGREQSADGRSPAASREIPDTAPGAGAAHHAQHGEAAPGHDHGGPGTPSPVHSAARHGSGAHAGHAPQRGAAPQPGGHTGHAGMDHGKGHAAPERTAAGHDEHAGHAAMSPQAPPAGGQPSSDSHAGHAPAQGTMTPTTAVAAPVAVPPGQPAATLRPDALDAPAATSVTDARRSAEMAEEMSGGGGHGGHGGHGAGTYRHVDAGRGPGAYEGSEDHVPGAGAHQHGPSTPPSGHEGHSQHEPPAGAAAAYACPMHPEVTSTAPGKCPKCGMELVKRRKG